MHEIFNMGCGFAVVVPEIDEARTIELLSARHPGSSRIGRVTDDAGVVTR
jgi:phosphoribosylformylglycinamidine cyclo-ligase